MKNSQYRLTQKRRKLNEMRRKGVTEANWKLDRESYDYLSKYFPIEPARYLVQTRKYMGTAGFPRILKVIDRAAHKGQAVIDTTLTKKDRDVLDRADIPYHAFRYTINLSANVKR